VLRTPVNRYRELDSYALLEHKAWRESLLRQLESADGLPRQPPEAAVDGLAAQLLALTQTLAATYGTPDLGNKPDPVDELVYIILSRRTREGAYQAAYDALKSRYPRWENLTEAPSAEIEETIRFSGLGRRKAQSLRQALGALVTRFGSCTLEPTRAWSDEMTTAFLCTLPEIGPKSAACVMMCSLDRPAFPVDAHVGRVLERLGLFRRVGIDLEGADHKVKQRLLWHAVPPSLGYPLHVNLLVHGRRICVPRKPRCEGCVIAASCSSRSLLDGNGSSRNNE
jgi:endonuclease III